MAQTITVQVDLGRITEKLDSVLEDEEFLTSVHNLLAKMCDPYVPKESGMLAQPIVDENGVHYRTRYAHYMYHGIVYGPNIATAIDSTTGQVLEWRSKPGMTKNPNGNEMQYNTVWYQDLTTGQFYPEKRRASHPKATKEWDKAMMMEQGDKFVKQVKDLLVRRAKELYG